MNAESALIAQLKQGVESAFQFLFDTHKAKVYNTALVFLQNETEAEDIVQEVFIEAFRSIHRFNEQAKLDTWLYRITINKCIDYTQYKKRKKRFGIITSLFSNTEIKEKIVTENIEHPDVAVENQELTIILLQAIQKLPENQKAAFIITKIEDKSQKEAAAILQINEKALESLLQRAKQKLRELLANYYEEHYKK